MVEPIDFWDIPLAGGQPARFEIYSEEWGNSAVVNPVKSFWNNNSNLSSSFGINQLADNTTTNSIISTKKFVFIDTTSKFLPFTSETSQGISLATRAVISMSNTGDIMNGDIIRITNPIGMDQIGGYDFDVVSETDNVNLVITLDTSNFSSSASSADVRSIIPNKFYPSWRYIIPMRDHRGITREREAIVTTSVFHTFQIGDMVRFSVKPEYGMKEINNVTAKVLSRGNINDSGTYVLTNKNQRSRAFRIDLDTRNFTQFNLPSSSIFLTTKTTPATVYPITQRSNIPVMYNVPFIGTQLSETATQYYMRLGANTFSSGTNTEFFWEARYQQT